MKERSKELALKKKKETSPILVLGAALQNDGEEWTESIVFSLCVVYLTPGSIFTWNKSHVSWLHAESTFAESRLCCAFLVQRIDALGIEKGVGSAPDSAGGSWGVEQLRGAM